MNAISTSGLPANLTSINATPAGAPTRQNSMATLDQGDFLRLLLTQLQQQDPLEPVDNEDMLAQMAQFSALAGTTETNATLDDIAAKLDALIALQLPAQTTPSNP